LARPFLACPWPIAGRFPPGVFPDGQCQRLMAESGAAGRPVWYRCLPRPCAHRLRTPAHACRRPPRPRHAAPGFRMGCALRLGRRLGTHSRRRSDGARWT
jgi:hypothetical protein